MKMLESQRNRILLFQTIGTSIFTYGFGCSKSPHGADFFISCALFLALALSGQITGGHFNPTLTLAAIANSDKKIKVVGYYIVAQLIGATIGSLWFLLITGQSYTPIKVQNADTTQQIVNIVLNQMIGSWIFSICVLTLTNKLTTHAIKSWQIYLSIPVAYYLARKIAGALVFNPAIAIVYQVLSGITVNSGCFVLTLMLIFPSLLGGLLGGLTMKYIYEPLLLNIRFRQEIQENQSNQK